MKLRFIPTSIHGTIDHVVGPVLVAAPTILGLERKSPEGVAARGIGSVQALYSNLTDYEMSMKNVVPMRIHLALDAVGGATLALLPQLTGARRKGKKHWLPHLAIGAFEVGLALLTKTEPPKTKAGRAAHLAKLVATAKVAKKTAETAAKAVL
ncbi:MAG TPA: hypothetical protein VFA37_04245 [Gaiellaceae bacterium]|nr:hypothetical protein [Gaiellaceae bacterium]